jgi:pimeloyl-ACP methyl ester carboxylesterase
MTPITFASSFGWFHDADGSCGIILCAAQGHEDLCTHKSLRLMADAFAASGYPSLRFDYAGTGDSIGNDFEADRIDTWTQSIEDAVQWLRINAQVDQIVLVGLRLGSALASLAAERLGSISGLILLAPAPSGRAYMRELSTFSRLSRKSGGFEQANKAANLEIAGFVFTPQTVQDISAIDLIRFRKPPAQQVLIMAIESQQTAADRLSESWSQLGSHVERRIFEDYAEFMMDPAFSRFPEQTLQQSIDWLTRHFESVPCKLPKPRLAYKPHEGKCFTEYPVFFETNRNLFGMMCVPKDLDHDRPAIVYLNAGANHHIGWGRSTVEVCRSLAENGLLSLRIDIAAIGDSPDPALKPDQVLYRDESTIDVSAAIDLLKSEGFHNITVIGLCAGAHLGFHTALSDPRISRVIMVNLQVFIWHKTDSLEVVFRESYQSIGFYLRRLFMLETWQKLSRGDVKARGILRAVSARLRKKAIASFSSVARVFSKHTSNDIATVKGWMKALDRRKVEQIYVFSVGDAGLDELSLYRRIKGGKIKRSPYASLFFIDNADHNLSQHAAREALVKILQKTLCIEQQKGAGSVSPPAPPTYAVSDGLNRSAA